MKFIHCSDLHLDAKMESKLSASRAKERREELMRSFSRLAERASADGVNGIIIAGDLFDTPHPSARCKKLVLDTIEKYSEIDFIVLPGNHDRAFFETCPELANLKLFSDGWTAFDYGNVRVCGSCMPDADALSSYTDPDMVNIVVLHGEDKTDFSLNDLKNKHIDYLALGHYHTYSTQTLDKRGVVCYSGCLEGRGFDECGDKGYSAVSVSGNKLTHNFVTFGGRRLTELVLDMSNGVSYGEQKRIISDALISCEPSELVRVSIVGTYEPEREKFYDSIISEYENGFFYIESCDRSVLKINPEDYMNDISLKGEFIRTVMREVEDETRRSRIIEYGLRALAGERVE